MCQSVDLVNTYMGVPTKVDCKAVFTTEFLPKIEPPEALIVVEGVSMTYAAASGAVEALRDVSFRVGRGELLALVGPSGCGKSTLLRIVAGLRGASAGRVQVNERVVKGPIADVGMVFQAPCC